MLLSQSQTLHRIHLIGICGTAMASLAGMLHARGYEVSGSDQSIYPPMSLFLEGLGIPLLQGFSEKNLNPSPDLVVIGNAISRGNPELEAVLNRSLNYASMAEVLKEFFIRGKKSIVVAGTHGKSTTTSLLAWILEVAGLQPSFLVGGIAENFGSSFKLGEGSYFIIEGDEYDTAFFDKGPKFMHYLPETVIFNNCEYDHADIYPDFDAVKMSFRRLINLIPSTGRLIAGWDDPVVRELSEKAFSRVTTYGLSDDAEWRASQIETGDASTCFNLWRGRSPLGIVEIPLSGQFNVKNVLAALVCAEGLGIDLDIIRKALKDFRNVRRRLEIRGKVREITVFDDFAHHPTAIKETLTALRARFPNRRIWAIFEPRSATSRRNVFQQEFSLCFDPADRVVLASVYAREKLDPASRLDVGKLVTSLKERGVVAVERPNADEIVSDIVPQLESGDVVVIMSNGGFDGIHEKLLRSLEAG
ncbi:MAG: UDP-N-acetylmuramate:L-alanyl-gamma-D-glutamyl-meso-diaminopimelate ligase [Terriglobia bacterium]